MNKISLDEKFSLFDEHWRPKTIAALNGQEVKLVRVQGEFRWHHHDHEDDDGASFGSNSVPLFQARRDARA